MGWVRGRGARRRHTLLGAQGALGGSSSRHAHASAPFANAAKPPLPPPQLDAHRPAAAGAMVVVQRSWSRGGRAARAPPLRVSTLASLLLLVRAGASRAPTHLSHAHSAALPLQQLAPSWGGPPSRKPPIKKHPAQPTNPAPCSPPLPGHVVEGRSRVEAAAETRGGWPRSSSDARQPGCSPTPLGWRHQQQHQGQHQQQQQQQGPAAAAAPAVPRRRRRGRRPTPSAGRLAGVQGAARVHQQQRDRVVGRAPVGGKHAASGPATPAVGARGGVGPRHGRARGGRPARGGAHPTPPPTVYPPHPHIHPRWVPLSPLSRWAACSWPHPPRTRCWGTSAFGSRWCCCCTTTRQRAATAWCSTAQPSGRWASSWRAPPSVAPRREPAPAAAAAPCHACTRPVRAALNPHPPPHSPLRRSCWRWGRRSPSRGSITAGSTRSMRCSCCMGTARCGGQWRWCLGCTWGAMPRRRPRWPRAAWTLAIFASLRECM